MQTESGFRDFLVTILSLAMVFAPLPAMADRFDPTCITSIVMHTTTGDQFVNTPNARHRTVRKYLEPDGLRIKQSNIRRLKKALGLKVIQVAGYFDCPGNACGATQVSGHPRDRDAEGRLSCKCGIPISDDKNPFYEVFDEDGAVPLDRLILEPNVAAKYADQPLYRCDHCGGFNYQGTGSCGGCGAAPPENPTYIQPEKEEEPEIEIAAASGPDKEMVVLAIIGIAFIGGVATVLILMNHLESEYQKEHGQQAKKSDAFHVPSPSHSRGSSTFSPFGRSKSPFRSIGGKRRGSNSRNGTFKY